MTFRRNFEQWDHSDPNKQRHLGEQSTKDYGHYDMEYGDDYDEGYDDTVEHFLEENEGSDYKPHDSFHGEQGDDYEKSVDDEFESEFVPPDK